MLRQLRPAACAFLGALWLALGVGEAVAERRIALVLGNSEYKDPSLALTNPGSDAQDIAATLKTLGFDVQLTLNANTREMDIALRQFGAKAATADVALFFYAGHALQHQGNNYLMPIDASLNDEVDLRRTMVSDEQIRLAVERSSGVRILILDACRNNPMADRFKRDVLGMARAVESTRGLARIDKAQGMLIAYAAAPGEVALDGNTTGRNSPFTSALLRRMQEPALEISTMFRRVTNDVWDQTKGRQRPEYSSTLRNDYYLDPLADKRIWERLREAGDISALRDFISLFPNSMHVLDAQRRIEILDRGRREREEQARLERERLETERVQKQVCDREAGELASIGNDYAKLQLFAQRATCDQMRSSATQRLNTIIAERQEAARRQDASRREREEGLRAELCRSEQATANLLWDDVEKLQALAQHAACEQTRVLVNERIKTVTAHRELAEKTRQEAERLCHNEQQTLVSLWTDMPGIQAFLHRAKCEQVRVTAAERIKTIIVERDRKDTDLRQQAARNCQTEQGAAAAAWNDLAALQQLASHSTCAEAKPALTARIAGLAAAQRDEQTKQQQAAERLAALEEDRNRQRREEERRQRAEEERQQALLRCKEEGNELTSLGNDLSKLQNLARRATCTDVRALASEKVVQIEREEKVCKDETTKSSDLLRRAKRESRVPQLVSFKEDMTKFEREMTCARLRLTVGAAVVTIRVKIAQTELKRVYCFSQGADGVLSDATKEAAKLFLANLGRPDSDGEINEALLSDLKDQKGSVCRPVQPPIAERPRKEVSRPKVKERSRQERQVASPPRPRPRAVTSVQPLQPPRPAAAPRQPSSSGVGTMIGIGN